MGVKMSWFLPFPSEVTMGRFCNFSITQAPRLYNEDNKYSYASFDDGNTF